MPSFAGNANNPASFTLPAGSYGLTANATWGGGGVALQRRASDGSTFVQVVNVTADGYQKLDLPAGTYKFVITTATAVNMDLSPIVSSQP